MVYKIHYSIRHIDNPEATNIDSDEPLEYNYFHGCIITVAVSASDAEQKFLNFIDDAGTSEIFYAEYQITELRAEGYKKYTSCSCRYYIDGTCILFDKCECSGCEVGEP